MNLNEFKKKAAWAALNYISPGAIVGIGTGSTVFHFIEALSTIKHLISGVVSSSNASTILLKNKGISNILHLNSFHSLEVYIDSADEINNNMQMIKGGGGALTKEKIIAAVSKKFICIIDETKKVNILGSFPLPIEIIPIASSFIENEIIKLGGKPKIRKNVITEHGNIILDIHNLNISDPIAIEKKISLLPGVVTVGLFALRGADIILMGTKNSVKIIEK
ncbi:ribose-5-phosphate isomerase RpiA [Buchnera aphidicola]|uniref:Ribose-5-phosphate isomerase A n=1 Tax=Buchnera aphidicola (Aphis gossypii) TaxID=98785 RepID=A0A5J6ZCB1_9GAMM|nr:ribose-5-phosphate isomerase RpiA [Buchnera aphidicola]QFQ32227.1 ribose-5-phosphate isomerase RpiA [Buchnera aphidicola (Aphis gossypii)]UPT14753.1 ribose-5-phosphate isomerase RpiA [Buchnera aphidicola (Aphis gossypii)]